MKKSLKVTCLTVLLLLSFSIAAFHLQPVSSQSSTVVRVDPSTTSTAMGQTFTVTVSITNVQNLYGLEVDLSWDPSVLQATSVDPRVGVELHTDGVLHESSNSPPIFIAENNLTQNQGEYRLTVTSTAPAAPYSGSGNIVKITFNPLKVSTSALSLQSELYDYPPANQVSSPIDHTSQSSSVTVIPAGAATPTVSAAPTVSSSPSSSTSPQTSSSTTPNPTSKTPTQTQTKTSKPQQKDNSGFDLTVTVAVVVAALLIAVFAVMLYRRRKTR